MREKIFKALKTAVIEGDITSASRLTNEGLEKGMSAEEILKNGLVPGMDKVGERYQRGDIFVPEMLISSDAMKEAMGILQPILEQDETQPSNKILIGTVQGDIHDIGKNLVITMCKGAGFQVVDLGVSVTPAKFIESIKEHQPHYLGLSAMLTTTMSAMGQTIEDIKKAGLRDQVKVIIGGAAVDQEFADHIGADGYGEDASTAPNLIKQLSS